MILFILNLIETWTLSFVIDAKEGEYFVGAGLVIGLGHEKRHGKKNHFETFDDDQWIENFRMKSLCIFCRDLEAYLDHNHTVRDVVIFKNRLL